MFREDVTVGKHASKATAAGGGVCPDAIERPVGGGDHGCEQRRQRLEHDHQEGRCSSEPSLLPPRHQSELT